MPNHNHTIFLFVEICVHKLCLMAAHESLYIAHIHTLTHLITQTSSPPRTNHARQLWCAQNLSQSTWIGTSACNMRQTCIEMSNCKWTLCEHKKMSKTACVVQAAFKLDAILFLPNTLVALCAVYSYIYMQFIILARCRTLCVMWCSNAFRL